MLLAQSSLVEPEKVESAPGRLDKRRFIGHKCPAPVSLQLLPNLLNEMVKSW